MAHDVDAKSDTTEVEHQKTDGGLQQRISASPFSSQVREERKKKGKGKGKKEKKEKGKGKDKSKGAGAGGGGGTDKARYLRMPS
jgi:hypothetical protein